MKAYIEERAVEVAKFIIDSNATVRETAKKFGISKSTVHTVVQFCVGASECRITGCSALLASNTFPLENEKSCYLSNVSRVNNNFFS